MASYKPAPFDAQRILRDDDIIVSRTYLAGTASRADRDHRRPRRSTARTD